MLNLFLGFVMDVFIFMGAAVGTAIGTVQGVTGKAEMPPLVVFLLCLCVAVTQAGRRYDSKRSPSPVEKDKKPPIRTPAELEAQGRAREAAAAAELARIAEIVKQTVVPPPQVVIVPAPPVTPTPLRVDPPPPVVTGPGVTRVPRERDLPGGTP
jgi:hypothetical protein